MTPTDICSSWLHLGFGGSIEANDSEARAWRHDKQRRLRFVVALTAQLRINFEVAPKSDASLGQSPLPKNTAPQFLQVNYGAGCSAVWEFYLICLHFTTG